MLHVYKTILTKGFTEQPDAWQSQAGALAELSVNLYEKVRSGLLPTPAKAHYQFNVR